MNGITTEAFRPLLPSSCVSDMQTVAGRISVMKWPHSPGDG